MSETLRTMVVMGSTRNTPTPWGGPARVGSRVGAFIQAEMKKRGAVKHEIDYVDLATFKLPLLETPFHFYKEGEAPAALKDMHDRILKADCYIFISPEYNHSPSPALLNFVDHFPPSSFAYKASAIAVYSVGPFGGVRAAMALRATTGELGCLSVAPIFGVPTAQNSLTEEGEPVGEDGKSLVNALDNVAKHLEFYALALKARRATAPQ